MKTETIVNIFFGNNQNPSIIRKIMNSIVGAENFQRRLQLKPAYRELKEIYETYIETEQGIIQKYIKRACEEENEKRKNDENWEKITPDKVNRVPVQMMPEYNKEIKVLLDTEVTIKKPLKFYENEIQNANLIFDEEDLIDELVMWGKKTPKPKK
jgi:hypothetical protein